MPAAVQPPAMHIAEGFQLDVSPQRFVQAIAQLFEMHGNHVVGLQNSDLVFDERPALGGSLMFREDDRRICLPISRVVAEL